MKNFNLNEGEDLIEVFDPVVIFEHNEEKETAIALTTERLLFLNNEGAEYGDILFSSTPSLSIYKGVYRIIALRDIKSVSVGDEYFVIDLEDSSLGFDDEFLYAILSDELEIL